MTTLQQLLEATISPDTNIIKQVSLCVMGSAASWYRI